MTDLVTGFSSPLNAQDLIVDQDPRIKDVRIGERLGMAQPLDIRRTIVKNTEELGRYGPIRAVCEKVSLGSGAVREVTAYYLNEGQTLLLCMLSRTARAADVRQEVIEVFLAHRRGMFAVAPASATDPWTQMVARLDAVERAIGFGQSHPAPVLSDAATHFPIWLNGRRPGFWSDTEVREAVTRLHREVTINAAVSMLIDQFGSARTPSRSALGRYWRRLDEARGNRFGRTGS
ncbi:hypothetical protein [Rhodospirillum sp. A1_3_36]|uniref:hypothetical protein n=1 Tax=Rhodospirillum sp. A1_3_36 TaxID=3391666 RepID=UPI0039A75FDE